MCHLFIHSLVCQLPNAAGEAIRERKGEGEGQTSLAVGVMVYTSTLDILCCGCPKQIKAFLEALHVIMSSLQWLSSVF